eukprot:284105-Prymnesium_polylepis.1
MSVPPLTYEVTHAPNLYTVAVSPAAFFSVTVSSFDCAHVPRERSLHRDRLTTRDRSAGGRHLEGGGAREGRKEKRGAHGSRDTLTDTRAT